MSRILIIFLAIVYVTNAFYLSNYYVGYLPYRYLDSSNEANAGRRQWRGLRQPLKSDLLQKNKKDATLQMKRFKPCYYSPIQCLIKRK